ncbi:MAG: BadF/BadG/BcrA/BcrD ATPase family protein [Alishewanella agri]|nr:BadF/BadG/BcrA/BcrD ATPase family protein [Alishewanella agri]
MSYLLAIDGGGTKTAAVLYHQPTGQRWQAVNGPAQLTNDLPQALLNVRALIQDLCQQAAIGPQHLTAVIGLAGAGNPVLHQAFSQQLALPFARWQLTTDARTSLYGANHGQPVAVVAIGTGSVGIRLQADGTEQQVGGWGFNIGDEGGGAWLGRELVRQLLWYLDWQKPLTPLLVAVATQCGRDAAALLPWLKQATASDFAALAPLVYQHAADPTALQLLQRQATAIDELAACCLAGQPLPLVLLGGLAEACRPYLAAELQQRIQPAAGDALSGGLVLAQALANGKKI